MRKIFVSIILITVFLVTGCNSSKESTPKQEDIKIVYCNDCGEESKEVTKYCPECGVEAKWVTEKKEVENNEESISEEDSDKEDTDKEDTNKKETIIEEETVVKDEVYVEKPKFTEAKAIEIFTNQYGPPTDGNQYVSKGLFVENGKTYCMVIVGPPNSGGWPFKVFEDGTIVEIVNIEDGVEIVQ